MTELANWIATGMPGNYNALAGYGFNPYDARPDPREGTNDGRPALNAGGSSSGAGTAANFWAANVGHRNIGLHPDARESDDARGYQADGGTHQPVRHHSDHGGSGYGRPDGENRRRCGDPARRARRRHARSHDPATKDVSASAERRLHAIPQSARARRQADRGPTRIVCRRERHGRLLREAIALLQQHGATVVDPADIPRSRQPCAGTKTGIKGKDVNCSIVFKYGMKRDFNAWLASLGSASPIKTLTALREWNLAHRADGAIKYGQAQLDNSDEVDLERDRARYLADRATDVRMTGAEGIDAVMKRERLDALLFPGSTGAAVAAKPGLSDRDRAVRLRPECAAAAVSVRVRCEARASGHQLYRRCVQRAAPDRDRVRVRAGNKAKDTATGISVREM